MYESRGYELIMDLVCMNLEDELIMDLVCMNLEDMSL